MINFVADIKAENKKFRLELEIDDATLLPGKQMKYNTIESADLIQRNLAIAEMKLIVMKVIENEEIKLIDFICGE